MLHNKYFEIIKQYLGDYNKVIYGRELIGKIPLSQKGIALALNELEGNNILKSERKGNVKNYRLNIENTAIRGVLLVAETLKKMNFLMQNTKIASIFKCDKRIVGIFGSYAAGTQKKDSDIDLFIIGDKKEDDYDSKGKAFDLEISIKYFSEDEFISLLRNKNPLCREIIANHINIFGTEQFIDVIWRNYYGFN